LQLIKKKVVKSAKECIKQHKSNSEVYGKMQDVMVEMDTDPTVCIIGFIAACLFMLRFFSRTNQIKKIP